MRLSVFVVVFALIPQIAFGQTAPGLLTGVVLDQTGAPVPQAQVALQGQGVPARDIITDVDGRFETSLPPGRYAITARHEGFGDTRLNDIVVTSGQLTSVRLEMRVAGLNELVAVTAGATPATAAPSTIDVSPLEVRAVAGAGENIFRVLQTLPGVAAVNDFDSRLSVRGGGPDQNLTLMDGVEIHNPYRLFGLTSAFNPETVEGFELTAGGFSAKYGDRLSSILVIENRDGTAAAPLAGTAALALTDANVIAEGKLPLSEGSSWLITGRRTYYDLVAERIVDTDLPSFTDLQGRAVWQLAPGRRFTFFGMRSREGADSQFDDQDDGERASLKSATDNDLGAVSFASTLGAQNSTKTTVSWYRNREAIDFDGAFKSEARRSNRPGDDAVPFAEILFTRNTAVRDVAVRQELVMNVSPAHAVEAGFEAHALDTSWEWVIEGDRNPDEANGSSGAGGAALPSELVSSRRAGRGGLWLTDGWSLSPAIRLEPGIRVDWSGMADEITVSPRVALVAAVDPRTRIRLASGLFTQSPGYEKLLQSDYFVDLSGTSGPGLRSERAWHAVAAIDRDITNGVQMKIEAYYKRFDRLLIGRLETEAETAARIATYDFPDSLASEVPRSPQITSMPVNDGVGRAYGVEFYVAKQPVSAATRLSGWFSYMWGRADTTSYGAETSADYDRRHAFSLNSNYRVSRLIDVATTVRVQTGFPSTPALGVRVDSTEDTADVDGDGSTTELIPLRDAGGLPIWTPDFGDTSNLNSGRLPLFARVDLRATFRPRWSDDRWQLYIDVINLLNRDNASSIDTELVYDPTSDRPKVTEVRSGRLPFLPSFGIRYRF